MKKIIFLGIIVLIYLIRLSVYESFDLGEIQEGESIQVEYVVTEETYHNGSNYINRSHGIYVYSAEPLMFDVGDKIRVIGNPKLRVIMGKTDKIYLYDPSISVLESKGVGLFESIRVGIVKLRQVLVSNLKRRLPEPHAGLASGMLLGVNSSMPSDFYEDLVSTGTLHTIAASGYNVTMVLRVVMGLVLVVFSRRLAIMIGFVAVIVYVVMAGGSPAVVRAGLMGILAYSAYFWGRTAEAKRLLWVVSYAMLVVDPLLLWDVGYQLSVVATAGILYFEPWIRGNIERLIDKQKGGKIANYFREYLYPTLAASLTTSPVIYYHFGRVSWVSPIANLIVLPLVPIIMLLAFVLALLGNVPIVGVVVGWLLVSVVEIFVVVVRVLG